jgi:putative transposase
MKFDPQNTPSGHLHHRRSIRLKGYDYTQAGAYFITMVTHQREPLFGEIVDREMRLSPMGRIADEHWRAIPEHFPHVELGAYVVMPNHVHGIIIITDGRDTDGRDTPWRVPTDNIEKFGKPVSGSLATIIRQYKSSVTRRIQKELYGLDISSPTIWQRNYYEHIIRNEAEYGRIHRYIESNIDNWAKDNENPVKSK